MPELVNDLRLPSPWTTRTYRVVREAAARCLARESSRSAQTPTDLVHETWLKLNRSATPLDGVGIGLVVRAMRETLVDLARRRNAKKRAEGYACRVNQESSTSTARVDSFADRHDIDRDSYVVALEETLDEMQASDPELARLVELRFYGGLEIDEIAADLKVSARTVKRRWQYAKALLHLEITGHRRTP